MPRKLLVQRSGSLKSVPKKVAPPTVPAPRLALDLDSDSSGSDLSGGRPPRSPSNGHHSPYISPFYSHPMKKMTAGSNGQVHLAHVIVHSQPDSPTSDTGHSPSLAKGRVLSGTQASLEDQGIESPGRHSPGASSSSSVSRHSLSSLDSGTSSSKVVNRRLSIQSYEGGCRRSYHSSSSSIASADTPPPEGPFPNVAEMVLHGLPEVEVLTSWLTSLHFEEYIHLFQLAGYDMPTITRMTPEDLTAIGITKPNHRRKLKSEIAKLNISDGIPEYKPNSLLEWLQILRLEEYYDTLCQQKYDTVDKVTELTWEDLEDIGIQKLGHQKKILLAIKRIDDINQGRRPNLLPQAYTSSCKQDITGNASFQRPSSLNHVHPFQYVSQEVAISTSRPKSSPSTEAIPEMKTFQQSPIREESLFLKAIHNSAQNINSSQNLNGTLNTVLSPTRGRSLESLSSEKIIDQKPLENKSIPDTVLSQPVASYSPSPQITSAPTEPTKTIPKDWQVTDLDSAPDFDYECEGTATLNRPKGLVKLKPMAKIAAKTREEIAEAIMDIPDSEFKSLINQTRTLDGWSSLDGSPRHGPSTVPRSATLKRPPPPVPKRNNSAKGEKPLPEGRNSAKCEKPLTEGRKELESFPKPTSTESEDFPPPLLLGDEKTRNSVEKAAGAEELFNNPLFKQRRKDSSKSADASSLPFANESVGTIKQNVSKPYPSLPFESSGMRLDKNTTDLVEHEYDVTPDAVSPGDVIDDIENMLANLSDQLDAMLDS